MLSKIQLLSALGALFMADSVSAHGHVMSWVIDGEAHAGFNPSNPAQYGATAERPTLNSDQGFTDFTAGIVACGGTSPGTGLQTLDIKGGSKVVAKWDTWPSSHKGPITQYMANCGADSCDGVDAASLKWFKISEEGFVDGTWAGEKLATTKEWPFSIPSDLASGAYLVRHDVLAMHTQNAPQVYPYCFQAKLASSGSVVPSLTTTFPAAYKLNTDFLTWSVYNGDQTAFVAPGPAVYSGGGSAPAPISSSSASTSIATSASGPASSSAPVTSSSAEIPSSSGVVSSHYTFPASSPTATVPSASTTDSGGYPAEPTVSAPTQSAPVESASASSHLSAPASPSASKPVTPGSGGGKEAMGGAAPPITEDGTRFKVNGGSYNTRADAVYASCMAQMNSCKNWANSLPSPQEVGAAFSSCDTQTSTCTSSSSKREVINRYAKRSIRI